MSSEMFNAEIFVSAQMEKQLVNMHMDFGMRLISECAKLYGFDANDAIRALNIGSLKMDKKPVAKKSPSVKKVKQAKASFPIPFNGKAMEGCCGGLRFNRGLYTQCQGKPAGESEFCKGCQAQADKNGNGKPDCGTIGDRLMAGLYDFQDPKGKSPIAFTALLKKLKLSEEAVKEEAGKLNIEIDDEHFEYIAIEKKKGRKSTKADVPKKEKKEKGRPKKSKKILELEGESSDLFASLVAQANASSESVSESDNDDSDELIIEMKTNKNEEKKAAEKAKKEEERQAKKLAAEAEKEAKRLAAEAEKEAKRKAAEEKKEEERKAKEAAKLAEKEAKRLAAEAEKEAKRKAAEEKKEEERKAKEAAKVTEKKEKTSAPKKENKDDGEPDVVKRFEFDGKKYLKSKKTGIIYNLDQDVIGKWNEETQKIDFYENNSDSEEEEEGYDSE